MYVNERQIQVEDLFGNINNMNYKIIDDLIQGSDTWLQARAWKISWTKLWGVMAWPKAQETLMFELIAEKVAPLEENYTTPAMQRWNDLEPEAADRFEEITWLKCEEVGIIKKNNYHILSPDRIIYNEEGIITKALEIKCLAAKKMLKYMTCETFHDVYKIEKLYFYQVVNYFLVIDTLEELSFMIYHPWMYDENMQQFIIKVTREDLQKDIEKAEEKISAFRATWEELEDRLLIKDAELCE